jgi:Na+-translocating ferredoxin:NAD+ oxidoreductase RnfD subunit
MATAVDAPAASPRPLTIVWPNRRDPRLKLSAVIISLQVLGQAVLSFKVSIAQILVTIGVCAAIEVAITLRRSNVLMWPASALLTGNSIAFILRASGTRHGDWWSLHGIEFFVLAAVLAMGSKYVIRPGGRHRFNPSNLAIVWTLLVIGPAQVFPQYLYWGPLEGPVIAALVVIALGAAWILRTVGMVQMALAFLVPFTAIVAVLAAAGASFVAVWHEGEISGASYWAYISTSPELLIFVFFMMSDPKTAPRPGRPRIVYGVVTAVVAGALIAPQTTEFGVKVAILAGLTVSCALVPLLEDWARRRRPWSLRRPAALAVVIIAIATPLDTLALTGDESIELIERGLVDKPNAQ